MNRYTARILFVLRYPNDIGHIVPVIWEWADSGRGDVHAELLKSIAFSDEDASACTHKAFSHGFASFATARKWGISVCVDPARSPSVNIPHA